MKFPDWTDADSHQASQIWMEYQQHHDLSDRIGQTVGIDPTSKSIWFGDSIQDIVMQRDREGLNSPLFFERIGSGAYFRKGRRLCQVEQFQLTEYRQSPCLSQSSI